MNKVTLPTSPEELEEALFDIFPEYRANYDGPFHEDTPTFHSVIMNFVPFFGANSTAFSTAQLKKFGVVINLATLEDGILGNAISTCLLEHLHQINAGKILRPYLSDASRYKMQA